MKKKQSKIINGVEDKTASIPDNGVDKYRKVGTTKGKYPPEILMKSLERY